MTLTVNLRRTKEEPLLKQEVKKEDHSGDNDFWHQIMHTRIFNQNPQEEFVEQNPDQARHHKKRKLKGHAVVAAFWKNPMDAQQVAYDNTNTDSRKVRQKVVDAEELCQGQKNHKICQERQTSGPE